MLEPTWMTEITRVPRRRDAGRSERPNRRWLVEAAPYLVAAVWMAGTLAAVIGGAATGRREMLEWCRSDAVLAGVGALAGITSLVGSLRRR
jgi:hypothetical protein